jgi:hypothetical protein
MNHRVGNKVQCDTFSLDSATQVHVFAKPETFVEPADCVIDCPPDAHIARARKRRERIERHFGEAVRLYLVYASPVCIELLGVEPTRYEIEL